MDKEVLIKITGKNISQDYSDPVELATVGKVLKKDGITCLTYDESDAIGTSGVKTMLWLESDKQVTLQRSGNLQSRLIIEQGVRHNCCYATVQGDITVGVFGEAVDIDLDGANGNVRLQYTVDVNMGLISRNEIEITVKEVQ